MNLNDFFGKELSISTLSLLIAGAVIVFAIIILVFRMMTLSKKLKDATTPKYGFAGKPLYQFVALLFIAAAIPLTIFAIQGEIHFGQQAEEKVQLTMDYKILSKTSTESSVQFSITPSVEGKPWGDKVYDIFWSFEGDETQTVFEFKKSVTDPSSVIVKLKKGRYKVRALVSYDAKSEEVVKNITIN